MRPEEAKVLAHEKAVTEVSGFPECEQRDALQVGLEKKYYKLYLADRTP